MEEEDHAKLNSVENVDGRDKSESGPLRSAKEVTSTKGIIIVEGLSPLFIDGHNNESEQGILSLSKTEVESVARIEEDAKANNAKLTDGDDKEVLEEGSSSTSSPTLMTAREEDDFIIFHCVSYLGASKIHVCL
jgi:hypothetical protein